MSYVQHMGEKDKTGKLRPREITVKVSGIRAGRSGKRFVKFTEEEARNNAAFWNGWTG